MIHDNREYQAFAVTTPAELAEKLTEHDWCGCNGFLLEWANRTLLYLNDSFSENGAQEYAVLMAIGGGQFEQIESVTFGWLNKADAETLILKLHTETVVHYKRVNVTVKAPADHGRCALCA